MPKINDDALRQVQAALDRYGAEVNESLLARTTKDTYLLHARNFVRWLDDDFEPGATLSSRTWKNNQPTSARSQKQERTTEQLEAEFHQAMVNIYHAATNIGYRPTYFLQLINKHGGVIAAKRLLRAAEPQSGLIKLWELDRLDISAEALVLQERWRTLFSDDERHAARERLRDYRYDPLVPYED